MKSPKKRRTGLKKFFLNITVALLCLIYTGNVIAMENAAQINSVLKTPTSERVYVGEGDPADAEYPRYFESNFSSVAELKEAGNAKVREVEGEGAVLLKNDNNVLPLAAGAKISLFGATAFSPVYGGTGSGAVSAADAPKYVDVLTDGGFDVINASLADWYVEEEYGRDFDPGNINEASWKKVAEAVEGVSFQGENAIFVIGRVGGEANDLKAVDSDGGDHEDEHGGEGDYLLLNKRELGILEGLKEMKDEGSISSIIVLINSANPVSSAFLNDPDYGVDAALWIGSVGQTGLYAVADILNGTVNPSGSLPDTWWVDNMLDPAMANFGTYVYEGADDSAFPSTPNAYKQYVVYQEGIYVGYRYTETRYEDVVLGTPNAGDFVYGDIVAYPFGYGMSYTSFELANMQVAKEGEGMEAKYTVTVDVSNTGSVPGKKTVQVYAQKPYTDYDKQNQIEKAAVELVGYGKTQILEPGASETVTVEIPEYYLTSYDALGTGGYILDEGTYYLTAAENSHAAANNILAAKGKTAADGMTAEGDAGMTYSTDYAFDGETYKKSFGTGAEVNSLFDFVDINRYEGRGDNSVAYVSRSDWQGTTMIWTDSDGDGKNDNYVKLSITPEMIADLILDADDIPADDGVEFPTMGSTETSFQLIDLMEDESGNPLPYDDPKWEQMLDQLTYDQMATICAVGLRMTAGIEDIGKPETLDHNGPSGVTQSYSLGPNGYATVNNDPDKDMTGTCYPCNGIIAATFNDTLAEEIGDLIGEDAMWAGYAGFYGTGINIHRSPYAGRVFEYYSEDGILTGLIAAKESAAIQAKGVYVYNKHFALNDQELGRQGISTWCNEQAMREIYLRAFELPIVYADAKNVMSALNRVGPVWAGASHELITDWLRGEAGMSGFAVTDMYEGSYMSKPHEVLAGNDIPDNYPGTTGTAVSADSGASGLGNEFAAYGPNGATPSAQVAQALRTSSHRVLYTVLHSRGMDGISADFVTRKITPWWQTALKAAQYALAALSLLAAVIMVLDIIGRKKEEKAAAK